MSLRAPHDASLHAVLAGNMLFGVFRGHGMRGTACRRSSRLWTIYSCGWPMCEERQSLRDPVAGALRTQRHSHVSEPGVACMCQMLHLGGAVTGSVTRLIYASR